MFRAATSGIDSGPYVKNVLGLDDGGEAEEEAQRKAEEERIKQEIEEDRKK